MRAWISPIVRSLIQKKNSPQIREEREEESEIYSTADYADVADGF
jgi:hypothetical protein